MKRLIYKPIYNLLVLTTNLTGNLALSVAIITIIVKIALIPVSKKTFDSQIRMKKMQPEIDKLKKEYGSDKNLHAQKTMELYKQNKMSPLSGCLPLIIQVVVLWSLYKIFYTDFTSQTQYLYSFVKIKGEFSATLFGMALNSKSIVFGVVAGIIQFIQIKLNNKYNKAPAENKDASQEKDTSFQAMFSKNMQTQMLYVVPALVGFVAYTNATLAIYFVVSSLFAIVQEYIFYKSLKHKEKTV